MIQLDGMTAVPLLQLSQGHLQTFDDCPRKFQYQYLDQIGVPNSPEEQARYLWGSRFHLLLQQHELGLAVESLAAEHSPLDDWLKSFLQAEPTIIGSGEETAPPPLQRQSEQLRSQLIQNFFVVAIYDLFLAYPNRAQILDWKTYPRPQNPQYLTQSWQTRLYLYLLAETSTYAPEQLSMTYWFFERSVPAADSQDDPAIPEFIQIPYSATLHHQTYHDLHQRLQRLEVLLADYADDKPFPQLPEGATRCHTCAFAVQCQRSLQAKTLAEEQWTELDFEQIPEVDLNAQRFS